ncbi:MAG TPA: GNAT family N-acetyltransferase [Patescibacteria group bacterium]|nr:GNAT family N-acetyltransferase [Patescibacteria group bacterium]
MEKLRFSENQFPESKERSRLTNLACLYAEIFAGPPWNEFTRSPGCSMFFGQDTKIGDMCPNCGDMLKEAYPLDESVSYLKKELARPNALLTLLEKDENIIGFAWGFSYENPTGFTDQKYKTKEMRKKLTDLFIGFGVGGSFFYFSECGVAPSYRGQGLSNMLSGEVVKQAEKLNSPLVMRTNYQSPMVYVAARFGMNQVMGPREGRIINFEDAENTDRVLFLKI